jgi:hypothetical protein
MSETKEQRKRWPLTADALKESGFASIVKGHSRKNVPSVVAANEMSGVIAACNSDVKKSRRKPALEDVHVFTPESLPVLLTVLLTLPTSLSPS